MLKEIDKHLYHLIYNSNDCNNIGFKDKKLNTTNGKAIISNNRYYKESHYYNFNEFLMLIKNNTSNDFYHEFIEYIHITDNQLNPGEYYDTLCIEISFFILLTSSNKLLDDEYLSKNHFSIENICHLTIHWTIDFNSYYIDNEKYKDDPFKERIRYNSYQLVKDTRSILTFVTYEYFMNEIEDKKLKHPLINNCIEKYKLSLLNNSMK